MYGEEKIRSWQWHNVTIALYAAPEDYPPEPGVDSPEAFLAYNGEGDLCGWFCARVEVQIRKTDIKGESPCLGGCSYASFEDFIGDGGYFNDLVADAFANLRGEIDYLVNVALQGYVESLDG